MNKEIIFFILFIFSFNINSIFSIKDDNSITLIVNSLINNKGYLPGGQCGNSTTFACNNINDAIEYFKTIATVENPTLTHASMYQKLNLKLVDGIYPAVENSVNLYEFDMVISPLNSSYGGVSFVGQGSPLFSIVTPSEGSSSSQDVIIQSSVTITGINFNLFNQSILSVDGYSNSYFTFDQCTFDKFSSASSSMIEAGVYLSPSSTITTNIIISNSSIMNASVRFETPLINLVRTSLAFENTQVSNVSNIEETIFSSQGYVSINNSSFIGNSNLRGIVFSTDSTVYLTNSSFTENIGLNSSSVLTFDSSHPKQYSFNIENCEFTNNTNINGVLFVSYSTQDQTSSTPNNVIGCTFIGNSAKSNSGAIGALSLPILIENSIFINNNALLGGAIYVFSANLTITNSSISSTASTQPKAVFIQAYYSTVYINDINFENIENGIVCDNSEMYFEKENLNFNTSLVVYCDHCYAKNNDNTFCGSDSTFTGDYSSSGYSTGDYTTSSTSSTSSTSTSSTSTSSTSHSTTTSLASQNIQQICKLMILSLSLISLIFI
ncbi:hypothetical protein ACTFIY_007532 [Dictyostelium cf. discoideum]